MSPSAEYESAIQIAGARFPDLTIGLNAAGHYQVKFTLDDGREYERSCSLPDDDAKAEAVKVQMLQAILTDLRSKYAVAT